MFVSRYTIPLNTTTSATTINIPISLKSYPVDQSELIKTQFVDVEVKKSINPIVDYEEARFLPVDINNIQIPEINYNMNFLKNGSYVNTYDALDFVTDDLKYRRNNFINSFLQLDFYDSSNAISHNYLFSMTLYCVVTSDMMINVPGSSLNGGTITRNNKVVNNVQNIQTTLKVQDPITLSSGVAEGYYIYDYKSDVLTTNKNIYMKASFNNAKNGKTTNFMVNNTQQEISDLVNSLHTEYTLKRSGDSFTYSIQGENVSIVNSNSKNVYNIDLYEVNVL